jgi:hypothetical protein
MVITVIQFNLMHQVSFMNFCIGILLYAYEGALQVMMDNKKGSEPTPCLTLE